LATISIASAKSYNFIMSEPAKAGQVELARGEYKVKVEGSNAIFTEIKTGKSVTTPVKVETTDKKHDETTVETTKTAAGQEVKSIELGGTKDTLEFGGAE
jgi:VCBS repeat-containing protein